MNAKKTYCKKLSLLGREKTGPGVIDSLEIYHAGPAEYESLSRFHYRENSLGPHVAIYAIRDRFGWGIEKNNTIGVIVYAMPAINSQLRNVATSGRYTGFGDRRLALEMLNREMRLIRRVIIDPRYRGLGLAWRLVAETMPLMNTPLIEAQAVMGRVNPFFERAGMHAWTAPPQVECEKLRQLLGVVGIEQNEFVDPAAVVARINHLPVLEQVMVKRQVDNMLGAYGRAKLMADGPAKIRYALSKLTERCVYYLWRNPKIPLDDGHTGTQANTETKQ